jgi:Ca-activated chloride channel family protein
MIHFIRPLWLFALLPAGLYLAWVIYCYRQSNPWKKVCDPHLLAALMQASPRQSQTFFNLLLFLFFSVSIVALAGPSWKKANLPIYTDVSSLMLVLDLSNSMLDTDLKPDRLTRAKLKIRDLISAAKNTQMGLVVFTDEAFVASPLSQDANTLDTMLDDLYPQMMPVKGSDSGQGLGQGLALMKQSSAIHGSLLLITASEPGATAWASAKDIAQAGDHLNVLAMMEDNASTKPTIAKLEQLAQAGNGKFYLFAADASDIQSILNSNKSKQAIKDEKMENTYLWQDAGPWFCLVLVPLGLVLLRQKTTRESAS